MPLRDVLGLLDATPSKVVLTVLCFGMRFHIDVSKDRLVRNSKLTMQFEAMTQKLNPENQPGQEQDCDGDADSDADAREELSFWILQLCKTHMERFSDQTVKRRPIRTLHDYFNIETLVLAFNEYRGLAPQAHSSVPNRKLLKEITPNVPLDGSIVELGLPLVYPWQVELFETETWKDLPKNPNKVVLDSQLRFFKPAWDAEFTNLKISTLLRIQSLGLQDSIRVPKLLELVRFNEVIIDAVRVSGMLFEYIEHRGTLEQMDFHRVSAEVRKKWRRQLKDGVKCLHEAGIVWGDAQPESILVDSDYNLWFIGLGGEYCGGDMDEDKMGTIEGDLQALESMLAWLKSQ
ncbi:hypothetical protein BDV18DRAFT_156946 [Aspergillus unguis]